MTNVLSLKQRRHWLRQLRLAPDRSPAFSWLRRLRAFNARVLLSPDIYGSYGSIHLVYLKYREGSDRKESDRDAFLTSAWAALALIEHNDPSAWRMIEREIKYLVNTYLSSAGEYRREQRSCAVDYERCFKEKEVELTMGAREWSVVTSPKKPDTSLSVLTTPNTPGAPLREWYIASLASTIVHEATHGRLHSLGIPYNKATRERIERLCVLRQRRFLSRLHSDHYDLSTVRPPFDVTRWHPYWNRFAALRMMKDPLLRLLRDLRHSPEQPRP